MLPEASHKVFAQKNIWVGRDVVYRTTIWLLSSWSSLISEWNDFTYSESPCCMMPSIRFLLKGIYGLEEVV